MDDITDCWCLWRTDYVLRTLDGITPVLASWERSEHPSQVRLRRFLNQVIEGLFPLPEAKALSLILDVDVEKPERLLCQYDLENYLTPLFGKQWLPASRFVLVTARKNVGSGSKLQVGVAVPQYRETGSSLPWNHYTINAGSGSSGKDWKERIRAGLALSKHGSLAAGPVELRLAWRCSSSRNWVSLWKPTGDAMGPILGCPDAAKPYHLNDDRITRLELHRNDDDSLGHDIIVGMWWRPVPEDEPRV